MRNVWNNQLDRNPNKSFSGATKASKKARAPKTEAQKAAETAARKLENVIKYETEAQYVARIRAAYAAGAPGLHLTEEGLGYFGVKNAPTAAQQAAAAQAAFTAAWKAELAQVQFEAVVETSFPGTTPVEVTMEEVEAAYDWDKKNAKPNTPAAEKEEAPGKWSNEPQLLPEVPSGTFTITNISTGNRRTFKITSIPMDSTFKMGRGRRSISLLSGLNNESDYTGIGLLGRNGVEAYKAKRGTQFETMAQYALRAIAAHAAGKPTPGVEVIGSSHCCRCNLKLTVPSSVHAHYGPICAGKVGM